MLGKPSGKKAAIIWALPKYVGGGLVKILPKVYGALNIDHIKPQKGCRLRTHFVPQNDLVLPKYKSGVSQ